MQSAWKRTWCGVSAREVSPEAHGGIEVSSHTAFDPQLCCLVPVWLWASYLPSLFLNSFTCKMGEEYSIITVPTPEDGFEDWVHEKRWRTWNSVVSCPGSLCPCPWPCALGSRGTWLHQLLPRYQWGKSHSFPWCFPGTPCCWVSLKYHVLRVSTPAGTLKGTTLLFFLKKN